MTGMIKLQKAFDMIDHDILLRAIGLSDHIINCFKSYFSDRLFR